MTVSTNNDGPLLHALERNWLLEYAQSKWLDGDQHLHHCLTTVLEYLNRLEDILDREAWLETAARMDLEGPYVPHDVYMVERTENHRLREENQRLQDALQRTNG